MKLKTLKDKLLKAQQRINNRNAERYIYSVIERFNNSNNTYTCSFPGVLLNFAWVNVYIYDQNGQNQETICIELP